MAQSKVLLIDNPSTATLRITATPLARPEWPDFEPTVKRHSDISTQMDHDSVGSGSWQFLPLARNEIPIRGIITK